MDKNDNQQQTGADNANAMPKGEVNKGAVEELKKLSRLLEFKRRIFLKNLREKYVAYIPTAQFDHLMNIRRLLPCNLTTIMDFTGFSSAGASIFVSKLVKSGVLTRIEDRQDRRNVVIGVTPEGHRILTEIDDALSDYVTSFFLTKNAEELEAIQNGCRVMVEELRKSDLEQDYSETLDKIS